MITILKHGCIGKDKTFTQPCPECGCMFSFTGDELYGTKKGFMIKCPECKKHILFISYKTKQIEEE